MVKGQWSKVNCNAVNFQVPQFIETEDKIIGPLTIRQFLYFAVAGGILFFILELALWLFFAVTLITIAAAFAFIKVNGRPLSVAFLSALSFYWSPRFYLWQKTSETPKVAEERIKISEMSGLKSGLDNLFKQLTTSKNPIPKREKAIAPSLLDRTKSSKERFEMMRKITGEREMARRVDYR